MEVVCDRTASLNDEMRVVHLEGLQGFYQPELITIHNN